jgi:hypothetical protein
VLIGTSGTGSVRGSVSASIGEDLLSMSLGFVAGIWVAEQIVRGRRVELGSEHSRKGSLVATENMRVMGRRHDEKELDLVGSSRVR